MGNRYKLNKTDRINRTNFFRSKLLLLFTILLFVSLLLSDRSYAGAKKAVADGSFVQVGLCGRWTDARWQQEFASMKEAGMHYLIIGAVAESADGQKAKMLYPSALPNTELNRILDGRDMVDICLRNAEAAGIKVFIGIGMNEKWWDAAHLDSTWLYNQMEFDNKVCDELWTKYKSKYPSTFYGWYWVYEVANVNLTSIQQNALTHAMNIQLDHLTAKNEKLPFMWCPFMNTEFGSAEDYKIMWKNIFAGLHTTDGDIFAPQDCVGAGGLQLSDVATWFAALREAADSKPGLKFWSDVETFDHHDWTSATIDRFVEQMKLEQPYVENYITFAYCHYNSPYNTDPGYHATYMGYLKTGSVENVSPTVPTKLKVTLLENGNVSLNWEPSTDNVGVCGYYIYRNGKMVGKRQVHRKRDDRNATRAMLTSFVDKGLNPNTTYKYQVEAYDFANNVSALTDSLTITTPAKDLDTQ